jgi:hypothetical protein
VSICAASAALSLASTAFCAISRSMLACKIATDVLSPVASAGCSGTRRRDSVGVTGAFRVEPRRGLSSVYLLSRPDQLRSQKEIEPDAVGCALVHGAEGPRCDGLRLVAEGVVNPTDGCSCGLAR